jgi:hypothetical protein
MPLLRSTFPGRFRGREQVVAEFFAWHNAHRGHRRRTAEEYLKIVRVRPPSERGGWEVLYTLR